MFSKALAAHSCVILLSCMCARLLLYGCAWFTYRLQALADAVPAKRKERRELAIFSAAPEISEDSGIGGSSKAQGSAGLGSVVEFEKKVRFLMIFFVSRRCLKCVSSKLGGSTHLP
jgi:hypothetical protein